MEYVLTGATLIDGNGGQPLADAAVYVKGERIAWPAAQPTCRPKRKTRSKLMCPASGSCPA